MKSVYYAAEIRAAEREAINNVVSEDALIERAADALLTEIDRLDFSRAVVFAGGGNNGSDALSLALRLIAQGRPTVVYLTSDSTNAFVQKRIAALKAVNADLHELCDVQNITLCADDLAIDGMLGIGCTRDITGKLANLIASINASDCTVVAIDIPTGLHADTGRVMGEAVRAQLTITFSALKAGLLLGDARNFTGRVTVYDIGIALPPPRIGVTEAEDISLPKRPTVSNKGTYGSVAIIAGSPTMLGASLLAHESALAALRSGSGYALLCVPFSLRSVYQQRVKEELLRFMPDECGRMLFDPAALDEIMRKAKSIVIGMGMGQNPDLIQIIGYLASRFEGTLIIDGDGLNALSKSPEAVSDHKCSLLLTPHVREFERLELGVQGSVSALPDTSRTAALAKELNAVIAMKSATTVISDGATTRLNITGTPAMAKAGSGDVLSGMVGGFAATSSPLMAALRACYEFGKAGERAATNRSETSILASDIITEI